MKRIILLLFVITFSGCEKEGMSDDGGYSVCKSGNIVAISTNNGCNLYDATNPSSPALLAGIDAGYSDGIAIKENILFISSDGSLSAYDISTPRSPVKKGSVTSNIGVIFLKDTLLFLKSYTALEIINIKDPENMKKAGEYNFGTSNGGNGIYVTGSTIYLANGVLQQYSFSSDLKISLVKTFSYPVFLFSSDGKYLYTTTYNDGVKIFNIEDNKNVHQESFLSFGKTWGISYSEGFLYVVSPFGGLTKVDISNMSSPVVVTKTTDKYQAHGILYDNGYLFVAGTVRGFFVLDADDLSVVFD
jgi:hypothetical protein